MSSQSQSLKQHNANAKSVHVSIHRNRRTRAAMAATTLCLITAASTCTSSVHVQAFAPCTSTTLTRTVSAVNKRLDLSLFDSNNNNNSNSNSNSHDNKNNNNNEDSGTDTSSRFSLNLGIFTKSNHKKITKLLSTVAVTATISTSILLSPYAHPANAENELSAKYGGKGFDSSLVDQTCLVDKCSLQAKACLKDDPDCRKGLTCTAKCLGDNACITGCMARYGDSNLDNLLKCTIEDHECIKVAILDGGADEYGSEPRPPAPTVPNFRVKSMEGAWYKVVGFNPNYDCYACQKNTFSKTDVVSDNRINMNMGGAMGAVFNKNGNNMDKLEVDVRFSMPRMMPDGIPPPPVNERETVSDEDGLMFGSQSIGFNDYQTREMMVFDRPTASASGSNSLQNNVVLGKGQKEQSYSRTAHSEGEMFGLKFWENWYIIGENDADSPEFKFVYYNGKTRQNTYDGAFVYSRNRELDETSMKKVYQIASDAGMNPDQFCKIRNGCFKDDAPYNADVGGVGVGTSADPFKGILASTKISQLLGVEPVAAEGVLKSTRTATEKEKILSEKILNVDADETATIKRAWWYEVGDYLEDPHRHFNAMDSLRIVMDWPEEIKNMNNVNR